MVSVLLGFTDTTTEAQVNKYMIELKTNSFIHDLRKEYTIERKNLYFITDIVALDNFNDGFFSFSFSFKLFKVKNEHFKSIFTTGFTEK